MGPASTAPLRSQREAQTTRDASKPCMGGSEPPRRHSHSSDDDDGCTPRDTHTHTQTQVYLSGPAGQRSATTAEAKRAP
jgi:hypothetical protein